MAHVSYGLIMSIAPVRDAFNVDVVDLRLIPPASTGA